MQKNRSNTVNREIRTNNLKSKAAETQPYVSVKKTLVDINITKEIEKGEIPEKDINPTSTLQSIPEIIETIQQVEEEILVNQDIADFYEYTDECFKRASKVVFPSLEEIKDFLIEFPHVDRMRAEGKKLCVWDLDETLIHCDQENPEAADVQIEVKFPKKSKHV